MQRTHFIAGAQKWIVFGPAGEFMNRLMADCDAAEVAMAVKVGKLLMLTRSPSPSPLSANSNPVA